MIVIIYTICYVGYEYHYCPLKRPKTTAARLHDKVLHGVYIFYNNLFFFLSNHEISISIFCASRSVGTLYCAMTTNVSETLGSFTYVGHNKYMPYVSIKQIMFCTMSVNVFLFSRFYWMGYRSFVQKHLHKSQIALFAFFLSTIFINSMIIHIYINSNIWCSFFITYTEL